MSKCYPLTFDGTSCSFLPLLIHARVKLTDPVSVDLKNRIDVSDVEGGAWLAKGKLRVVPGSKRLIEARRAAEFALEVGPSLTMEDILSTNRCASLKVTLFPDKTMVIPGSPVPIDVPPVSSVCQVKIGLPAVIETDTDPFLAAAEGRDGVYLSAQVKVFLPGMSAEAQREIRDSITFVQRSGQIIVDGQPKLEGPWKRVLVYPLPGNEHLVREQNNIVEVTARVRDEELQSRVILSFEEQGLQLFLEPENKLKLNGRDTVRLRAQAKFSSVIPVPKSEQDAFMAGLNVVADAESNPILNISAKSVVGNQATWIISGFNKTNVQSPAQASLRVASLFRSREVSASTLLKLEEDTSSLEAFFQPSLPLLLGEGDGVWLYAKVKECGSVPKSLTAQATKSIVFSKYGANADLIRFFDEQDHGDYRAVRIKGEAPGSGVVQAGMPMVNISTDLQGKKLSEDVSVSLELGAELKATVKDATSVVVKYDSRQKKWVFPEIKAFFSVSGQDKVIRDGYRLKDPAVLVPGDVLIAGSPRLAPSGQWMIALDVNKAASSGFEEMLATNKKVAVQVCGESLDGSRSFLATVIFHFVVEYDLLVEQVDENGIVLERPRGYVDPRGTKHPLDLQPGEVVADTKDSIFLRVRSKRKDQKDAGKKPEPGASASANAPSVKLEGPEATDFEINQVPAIQGAISGFYYKLSSKRALLATPERLQRVLTVSFALTVQTSSSGDNFQLNASHKLTLKLLHLRFWAYPAMIRGQSMVSACVSVFPERDAPVGGLGLELEVVRGVGDGPSLKIIGGSKVKSDEDGSGFWAVSYSGLTWKDVSKAKFHLKCRAGEGHESINLDIDVDRNGKKFLEELNRRASLTDPLHPESLDLTNQEFASNETWLALLSYAIPDDCNGLFYNLRSLFYGTGPDVPSELYRYTCGEMRKRITDFAVRYRYDKDTGQDMNGVEFANFALGSVHDFFGIHLSGESPGTDDWFFDPWWRQRWLETEIAHSKKTERWKAFWVVTFVLCELALVCMFIYKSGAVLYPRVKHLLPEPNSWRFVQRLRAALARLLHGEGALLDPNSRLAKALSWSWFLFKCALVVPGLPYLLRFRVMAHDNYFEENFDYKPATLMRRPERDSFVKRRATELNGSLPGKLSPLNSVERW